MKNLFMTVFAFMALNVNAQVLDKYMCGKKYEAIIKACDSITLRLLKYADADSRIAANAVNNNADEALIEMLLKQSEEKIESAKNWRALSEQYRQDKASIKYADSSKMSWLCKKSFLNEVNVELIKLSRKLNIKQ